VQASRPTAKPAKQRRMIYQAPDHVRHKLLGARLSAELQASHGIKTLPVRNGDTVFIMRGDHKGFEGKITRIDRSSYRILVEGLTREKVDGTAIFVPVHPSKVKITGLMLDDKWRKKILERKKQARKGIRRVGAGHAEEIAKVEEVAEEEVAERKVVPRKKTKAKKPRRLKIAAEKPGKQETEEKRKKTEVNRKPIAKKQGATRKSGKNTGGE
jgi:large subunit ribosomal protein L24